VNVSLAAAVLSRYPLTRAPAILDRFPEDRAGNVPLALAERIFVQLGGARNSERAAWPQLPRPFLLAYFSIVEGIPPGPRREAWAELLIRAVNAAETQSDSERHQRGGRSGGLRRWPPARGERSAR